MKTPILTIELVPKTSWYKNLRQILSSDEWRRLRQKVFSRAGWQCEICGFSSSPFHCHEVWHYDDTNHIQTLERMSCLCPACHQVKHIGLAQIQGKMGEAFDHLATVNDWSYKQAQDYVTQQFNKWAVRSQHQWTVKTFLNDEEKRNDLNNG